MSLSHKEWKLTPCIVVEDIENKQSKLDFMKDTDVNLNTNPKLCERRLSNNNNNKVTVLPPLNMAFSIIAPEVDAYVTPLSLCHPPTPQPSVQQTENKIVVTTGNAKAPLMMTSGSESSFTSVDIGTSAAEMSWWSDSRSQVSTTGCCDVKTGLSCIAQAFTGIPHPNANFKTEIKTREERNFFRGLKKKPKCSKVAMFFIFLAIISIIAVGIALYVEFVSKPAVQWQQLVAQNRTNASLLEDAMANKYGDLVIHELGDNSTDTINATTTSDPVSVTASNDTGRAQASFSNSFLSAVNQLENNS